jgi:sugar phosphate isomerase/epimerase
MLRRNMFKSVAALAAAGAGSSFIPAAQAMPCKKYPLQAIALCAINLPPKEFAVQAKKAGYEMMGLRIHPIVPGALAHEFKAGTPEIRDFKKFLADTGIVLHGVDGFAINSDTNPAEFHQVMDACAELGVKNLTLCGDAPDKQKFARILQDMADYAAPRGFNIDVEFMIWRTIGTLEQAYELVKMADRKNCTIACDTLHLYRSGGSHEDIKKIPERYLGEIHLCDAVIDGPIDKKLVAAQRAGTLKVDSTTGTPKGFEGVVNEARLGRLIPGVGELPLVEFLKVYPERPIGVEVPLPGYQTQRVFDLTYEYSQKILNGLCK